VKKPKKPDLKIWLLGFFRFFPASKNVRGTSFLVSRHKKMARDLRDYSMIEDKKSDFNNAPVLTMKRKRVNGDGGRAGMPGPPFNCKNVPDPRYEN
jgi:hypothetical protein